MSNQRLPRYSFDNSNVKGFDRVRRSNTIVSESGRPSLLPRHTRTGSHPQALQASSSSTQPSPRNTWRPPLPSEVDRTPKVLDIIGCHREITICGHVDLIRRLPFRESQHAQLLEQYMNEPGNYEGRYSDYYDSAAKLLDYGNSYVAVRLYDDITRPEMSEFLLSKGWKMIGFAANKEGNKTYIIEKWCNIRDH